MSNVKLQFADDVKRLLAMFPGIAAYAEEAAKVGSLEQAAEEAEQHIARAKQQFDQQKLAIEQEHSTHLRRIEKAKTSADQAKADADKIVAAAHQQAARVFAEGQARAERLIADGQKTAASLQATAEELQGQIDHYKNIAEQARQQAAAATEEITKLTARKQQLRTSLDELKARI